MLERWVCRPPAAVPSSEEGSAKQSGEHPPCKIRQVILKCVTAGQDSLIVLAEGGSVSEWLLLFIGMESPSNI